MLTLYKRSFFGPITNDENRKLKDLTGQEVSALAPLVLLVVLLGVYPKPVLDPIDNSVKQMIVNMEKKALNQDTKDFINEVNSVGKEK